MDTFQELEGRYSHEPVRLPEGQAGHGALTISGAKSQLRITTSRHISTNADKGWFDLTLEQTNGERIFLHNALLTSSSMPDRGNNEWELRIFPNIVAFNAAPILPKGFVRELRFRVRGLEEVFSYGLIEWQSLYRANSETKAAIRGLRNLERQYPREYDRFDPSDIFVTHSFPKVLRVLANQRAYEIFVGQTHSHGRHRIEISSVVYATIRFGVPVSLDDALEPQGLAAILQSVDDATTSF